MEKGKGAKTGLIILAVLVTVGLMIFGMSMMLERDRSETALAGTEKKLDAVNVQAAALSDEVAQLTVRAQEAETALEQAQTALEGINAQYAALEERAGALESENQALSRQLQESQASLETLQTENTALWQAYSAADAEKAEALSDCAQTQTALSQAQESLNTAQTELEDAHRQLAESQTESAALQEKLIATQQNLSALQGEMAETKNAREEALIALSDAQAELSEAKNAQMAADTALTKAQEENNALQMMLEEEKQQHLQAKTSLARITQERDALQTTLSQTQQEVQTAQTALADMTRQRDDVKAELEESEVQLGAALESLTAAQNEMVLMQETAAARGMTVQLGAWVMEPYTFEVPDHVMMQQDTEGGWHFYYDEAGSVLSLARMQNQAYLDDTGVQKMYADTVNQLAQALGVSGEQAEYTPVTINGKQALLAKYSMADMTLWVLQYCHDGVNTMIASFTDVSQGRTLAQPVMEKLMDSVVYLPDEM